MERIYRTSCDWYLPILPAAGFWERFRDIEVTQYAYKCHYRPEEIFSTLTRAPGIPEAHYRREGGAWVEVAKVSESLWMRVESEVASIPKQVADALATLESAYKRGDILPLAKTGLVGKLLQRAVDT